MNNVELKFYDDTHKFFFYSCMSINDTSIEDRERVSLFYLLGLNQTTRENIRNIYDFDIDQIILEAPSAPFQTNGSRAITLLAFNLYNNYNEDNPTILETFCSQDFDLVPYVMVGILLRLGMQKPAHSLCE